MPLLLTVVLLTHSYIFSFTKNLEQEVDPPSPGGLTRALVGSRKTEVLFNTSFPMREWRQEGQ